MDEELGERLVLDVVDDISPPPTDEPPPKTIPAWLLYRLADDSPLGGLWNMKSVSEKLADLGLGEE